ncbi:hypothetical protein D7U92_04550 [Stenotrophomonas maltophilia]|nr:hypothetical protein [Stenotrophomonas maltophilia]MBA0424696.1 hypothetical protein [Stenotrophomonas maltophilia]
MVCLRAGQRLQLLSQLVALAKEKELVSIDIHDLQLAGIRLDPVSGVTVSLFDDSVQGSYDLVFGRVRKASIDGFSSQNVVLDLKVFNRKDDSFEFQRCCFLLGLDPVAAREIVDGDTLVFIEASVGAEIALLVEGTWEGRLIPVKS